MKVLVIAAHASHALAICQDLPAGVVIIDDAVQKGPTLESFERHVIKNIQNDLEHLSAIAAETLILIPHNYGHRSSVPPDGRCMRGVCTEHGVTRYSSRESRHPP